MVSRRSTCLKVLIGAIIVKEDQIIATGYVGAPRHTRSSLDHGFCLRQKLQIPSGTQYELCRSVHAEQNAIINAARAGVSLLGGDMYIFGEDRESGETVFAFPCFICKKMIINAGLNRIVVSQPGAGALPGLHGRRLGRGVAGAGHPGRQRALRPGGVTVAPARTVHRPDRAHGVGQGRSGAHPRRLRLHLCLPFRHRPPRGGPRRSRRSAARRMQDIGNRLRAEGGAGVLGRMVREQVLAAAEPRWVIDGIRNPAEVLELKKIERFFPGRHRQRHPDHPGADEGARARHRRASPKRSCGPALEREWGLGEPAGGQQVGPTLAMADFTVANDGTLAELQARLDEVLKKIGAGHE